MSITRSKTFFICDFMCVLYGSYHNVGGGGVTSCGYVTLYIENFKRIKQYQTRARARQGLLNPKMIR